MQTLKNSLIIGMILWLVTLTHAELRISVGQDDFSDWSGVSKVWNNEATFESGAALTYQYADCNRVCPGMRREVYGDAFDFTPYAGMSFEIYLKKQSAADVSVTLKVDPKDMDALNPASTAKMTVLGKGWQKVFVPWDLLDVNVAQREAALQFIKNVEITVHSPGNETLKIRDVQLVRGEKLFLDSTVQGRSAEAGGSVSYEVEVGNTTDEPMSVQLMVQTMGWESMPVSVEPAVVELAPGEVQICSIEVDVPAALPQGVREKQVLLAIPNGDGAAAEKIEYTTAVAVPFPNIVFTEDGWQQVKDKIVAYDWAKEGLAEYEKKASKWMVPAGRPVSFLPTGEYQSIFTKGDGDRVYECGIAYRLTGNKAYAEKVAKLMRRLISMEDGYPVTLHGGGDSFVAEGVFFQGVTRAYDMIRDAGVFTEEETSLIEHTFRLYINRCIEGNQRGGIGNWNIAEITGAVYAALCLQDWHLVEELMTMPTGIEGQISHGVMGDGWWYECSVGYNLWVATEFCEIAVALEPWGINLKDKQFAVGTTAHYSLEPDRRRPGLYGMSFDKWGALETNSVGIKDMWDAVLPFLDYRGVLFAINDAKEDQVTAKPYEIAYYLYGDPEYAAVIKRGDKRDLLYGVPELPDVTSKKMTISSYADNIGAVLLRSQTEGREQREQIQAALHYGTHGGYHGHFDRAGLIHLARYGRSFYNPEMFWYGYGSYLYKFLVQTSMTKNMVVVDQKQQEPQESFRRMFYAGDMIQASVVETAARWSHPPYGGIVYSDKPGITFKEKSEEENRSLYVPEATPEYGKCTGYTDDAVLQRRLMIMMDDFVVLADYLKAEQEHTFDWLMQIKGFRGLTADICEPLRHDKQMNPDPFGAAQFITDCQWYKTEGTSRASFKTLWGEGADNAGARMPYSEEGPLYMDVFNAWPQNNEIMIGTAAESFIVCKRFGYTVAVDGETLVDDSTGAWVLGARNIEADLTGKKELVLTSRTENPKNNTLFWGNARLILKDGSEVFIADLPAKYENIQQPPKGEDYYGGPIKIEGELMARSTPAQPQDKTKPGQIRIDLSGMDVIGFKATVGGDFPMGDEAQRRKTMAVRSTGTEARYLSVIEPYETESIIKSVTAKSANELTVELTDGRVQEITIAKLASDSGEAKVSVTERLNGEVMREEKTFE